MKNAIIFLFAIAFSSVSRAQDISFDQYFLDEGSLRMDVFQCGTADSSHYVFERFVIEPYFGGSTVNLVDPFNFGTNRVKVIDAQTNTLIYSKGYNTLFQEWQTTDEARVMERCYEESVSVPLPRNEAYIILEIRNFDGEFGLFGAATAEECEESFAAIKNAGYDGTVSIEPDAAAVTPESLSACLDLMRRCAG